MRRKRAATAAATVAAVAALALAVLQVGQLPKSHHSPGKGASSSLVHLLAQVGRLHPRAARSEITASARVDNLLLTDMTRALASSSGTSNVLISSSSLAEVLTQLELGARGATATQIAAALGASGMTANEQATGWNLLSQQLESDARGSGVTLQQRNGIFLERTLKVEPAYLNELAADFGEGVWRADFRDHPLSAARAISEWARQVTHIKLPPLLSDNSINSRTAFVVANALHFEAAWSQGALFNVRSTKVSAFRLSNGKSVSVPMMHLSANLDASSGNGVVAVSLPYGTGGFSALAIEPSKGSLTSLLASWSPARLAAIVSSLHSESVTLGMPRFSIAATTSCDSALQALGIQQAYTSQADFSGITHTPVDLSLVSQSARITVNEHGTDAGAASSAVVEIQRVRTQTLTASFNHPFLFVIRDDSTGAVLFEAVVANPAAST